MSDTEDFTPAHLLEAPPPACTELHGGLRIPIALLTPSPLNPRKRWTPERVQRMVASLKTSGQVQPIRVRPNPQYTPSNGRPAYEIVVGETRWRAAPEAGLAALDAVVGDYTDQQVIELGVVENTDRNDLHPLEEAEAYQALMRKPDGLQGYADVKELAARFGTSPSYVYQRLKLLNLCPAGREAFLADKIKASVALLIARMPDMAEQAKATATLAAGWAGEPYSFRNAAELLQREYMLALAKAPFDIAASFGVAGPCHQCPKRSGAAPDLFADVTGGDMCQDSRCYQAKAEEAKQAKAAAAQAEAAAEAAKAPAVPAPGPAPIAATSAPGKASAPAPQAPTKPAAKPAAPARQGGAGEHDAEAQGEKRIEALTRERFGPMLFRELADAARREGQKVAALRLAVVYMFRGLSYEASKLVYEAQGWKMPDFAAGGFNADFEPRSRIASPAVLAELLVAVTAAEALSERLTLDDLREDEHDTELLLNVYGVDPEQWWRLARVAAKTQVAQEQAAAAPANKAGSAAGVARGELTPTEAFVAQHGPQAAAMPAKKARPDVKYRDARTGETWSGRGLQPKWLKVALASGKKLSDFATTPAAPAAAAVGQTDEGDRDADA